MEIASFASWLFNHFSELFKETPKEEPLPLFFDGHMTHVSIPVIQDSTREKHNHLHIPSPFNRGMPEEMA